MTDRRAAAAAATAFRSPALGSHPRGRRERLAAAAHRQPGGGANGDGNNFQNLTQTNGTNLNVEAGTYDFKLYISCEGKNHVVITKK